MPVDILMPELGESVHEGTVSRWLKKIGDYVKEDEPVVEIMTDKVNTELGAPASGVLVKIIIPEGGDVEVFHAMGVIEPDEAAAKAAMANGSAEAAAPVQPTVTTSVPEVAATISTPSEAASLTVPNGERRWYSPLVKSMAKQHGVTETELSGIAGTGAGGRVNRKDFESYLANRGSQAAIGIAPVTPTFDKAPTVAGGGPETEVVALTGMRKMIAEAMTRSSQVPVVSTLTEVDVSGLVSFRELNKDSFQKQYSVKLTYTPFFIKAITESLLEFPYLNSSLVENQITVNRGVHMGVAVSLGEKGEGGLIVPVIRDCHKKSIVDIAKDLESIAARARGNKLDVKDVQGATFTLTNPGSYGAILGTPMINAPQSGILGAYGIVKRTVVVNDMIAIRSMMNLVLTYDHRIVDGLMAGRFLQSLKAKLENMEFFK